MKKRTPPAPPRFINDLWYLRSLSVPRGSSDPPEPFGHLTSSPTNKNACPTSIRLQRVLKSPKEDEKHILGKKDSGIVILNLIQDPESRNLSASQLLPYGFPAKAGNDKLGLRHGRGRLLIVVPGLVSPNKVGGNVTRHMPAIEMVSVHIPTEVGTRADTTSNGHFANSPPDQKKYFKNRRNKPNSWGRPFPPNSLLSITVPVNIARFLNPATAFRAHISACAGHPP